MVFDHGFDAVNCFLQGITIFRCLNMDSTQGVLLLFIAMFGFFTTTFETYVTHFFLLPVVNAVNEGMVVILSNVLLTVFVGPAWWNEVSFGYRHNTLFLIGLYIAGIYTIINW